MHSHGKRKAHTPIKDKPGGGMGGGDSSGGAREKRRSSGGPRRSWIPQNEETSVEAVGVIRTERFAAARARELEAASMALPPLTTPSKARLARLGAPPARMPLRRRAASFRPYTMPLSVRQNLHKRRKMTSGAGVRVLCRACRRNTRLLASRQRDCNPQQPGVGTDFGVCSSF